MACAGHEASGERGRDQFAQTVRLGGVGDDGGRVSGGVGNGDDGGVCYVFIVFVAAVMLLVMAVMVVVMVVGDGSDGGW